MRPPPGASRYTVTLPYYHVDGLCVATGSGSRYLWSRAVQNRHQTPPPEQEVTRQVHWPARLTRFPRARLLAVRVPRGTVIVQERHLWRVWAAAGAGSRYLRIYTVQTRLHSSPLALTVNYTVSWAVCLTAVARRRLCRPPWCVTTAVQK